LTDADGTIIMILALENFDNINAFLPRSFKKKQIYPLRNKNLASKDSSDHLVQHGSKLLIFEKGADVKSILE